MYPQNKKDALPAKMAARALDKKHFKQQMNYIVLVQIGNHFIQFVMSFLVRPSTKATQPVLLFSRAKNRTLYTTSDLSIQIQSIYKKCHRLIYVPYIAQNHSTVLNKVPQGYDSGERSRATHDCPLVPYYMGIPLF